MRKNRVSIIGIPPEGSRFLSSDAARTIARAELLIAGKRHLASFPTAKGKKTCIGDNLAEILNLVKANLGLKKKVVILATGDPNFFGVARYIVNGLGKDAVEIVPNVSAMQVAFARIKETWDDAVFASVHSRPIELIVDTVRSNPKVCLLTDERNSPALIAARLLEEGIGNRRVYVCQDLASARERIICTDLRRARAREFSPLSIIIIMGPVSKQVTRGSRLRPVLGIPEDQLKRRNPKRSLITKLEVRAVSLAKLRLHEESVVWDIGAGTGALSLEAASLAHKGRVFAIERNSEDTKIIRDNLRRFPRNRLEVVHADAPDGLESIPDPTSVFIGGSGGRMAEILHTVCKRLQADGRLVINAVTLESLNACITEMERNGFASEITLLSVARSKAVADLTRLEALNPVFVIAGWRAGEKAH